MDQSIIHHHAGPPAFASTILQDRGILDFLELKCILCFLLESMIGSFVRECQAAPPLHLYQSPSPDTSPTHDLSGNNLIEELKRLEQEHKELLAASK